MKENELKEIFLAEALEGHEELNKLFTELEKDGKNKKAIESVFRITHTLKANAAGMGFDDIASMSHILEDVFSEIRTEKILIDGQLFNDLFRSIDMLGAMLNIIKDNKGEPVKYKGLKTKLEAMVRKARFGVEALPEDKAVTSSQKESKKQPETIKDEAIPGPEASLEQELPKINKDQPSELEDIGIAEISNKVSFSDLVQIPVRKLDNLMNLVGELLIERDRIITIVNGSARKNEFTRLQRITSELQYSVMDVRLVQVNVLFNKFFRIVRDTASIENKKVDLILEGTENEIDRNVLQIISDSLVHLVRNAVSHGIETPEERKKAGKSEIGKIHLRARSDKDAVIIEVQDDGKGINGEIIRRKAVEKGVISPEYARTLTEEECIYLIFEAGFSSADQITSVSGRGVGMDVVKKAIDSIGGKIAIKTEVGNGSVFSLSLPSSMALKAALLFSLGNTEYAIPLTYTESVIQLTKNDIHKVGNGLVGTYLNRNIAIIFLSDFLNAQSKSDLGKKGTLDISYKNIKTEEKLYIVVVSCNNREIGFVVDKLHQQKEIVEKTLSPPLDQVDFVSGATILGNGNVCLVLDIPSIVNQFNKNLNYSK